MNSSSQVEETLTQCSDTIAASLIYIFYELAMNPLETEKLHAELQGVDIDDRRALEKLSHLNAVINEGMRLHPALPTGGYRILPAEGVTVAGRYIPGGTTLVAPRYHIFRCKLCKSSEYKGITSDNVTSGTLLRTTKRVHSRTMVQPA